MDSKDYIVILISAFALLLSIISLIISLIQKNDETKRTVRKNLSDTLESITKISIENAKLKASKDVDYESDSIILLRRNYNNQRRVLIAHTDYLIQHYDNIVTEVDCVTIAGNYSIIGDQEKAEFFWNKAIQKSITKPTRIMNLRGFGTFLFNIGKQELGRKYFDESLSTELPDNDESKALHIDTCLMLCELEKEYGNKENYENLIKRAMAVWSTIKRPSKKEEIEKLIRFKIINNI